MKKYIIIIPIALLIGVLIFLLCNKPKKERIEKINSFSLFYTNGYAINSDINYEVECEDKCIAVIKPYGKSTEESITVDLNEETVEKIIDLFNKYEVFNWDGFNKFDPDVLDGDSFTLYLTYDDIKKVSATGYMMWPKNYREVEEGLNDIFNSLMEE